MERPWLKKDKKYESAWDEYASFESWLKDRAEEHGFDYASIDTMVDHEGTFLYSLFCETLDENERNIKI